MFPFDELLEMAKRCERPFPYNYMDPEEVVGRSIGIVTTPIDMNYYENKRRVEKEQNRELFGYDI